jgi:tRNA (cytidine56-2'-O)-methyltransferase
MEGPNITVLRLGHRPRRDRRMTTHVALVARALGARSVVVCEADSKLERAVEEVNKKFGGEFSVRTVENWKSFVRKWKGPVVHLTMYGEPLETAVKRIPKGNMLVIVGAEKVPPEAYDLAEFNVAVTNQPHSEVASLTIFLDRMTEAKWTSTTFEGPKIIVPTKDGKTVINMDAGYLSDDECRRILREAGCDEEIIEHAESVAKIAVKMAKLCDADVDLVRVGALLHDIGRTRTHGPEHGHHGGVILRGLCFPEKIVSVVERHVGGGLNSEEAAGLGLPEKDLIPNTIEEKIVCIGDKMIEENRRAPIEREIQKLTEKGLDKAAKRITALYTEIGKRCGLDLDDVTL